MNDRLKKMMVGIDFLLKPFGLLKYCHENCSMDCMYDKYDGQDQTQLNVCKVQELVHESS